MAKSSETVHAVAIVNGDDGELANRNAFVCPRCSGPNVDVEYRDTTFRSEHNVRKTSFDCFCHGCSTWSDLHMLTHFEGKPRTWFYTTPKNWKRYTDG